MSLRVRIIATVVVAIFSASTGLLVAQSGKSLSALAMDDTGQSSASSPMSPSVREPQRMPRFDIFLGYSYLRAVPELANGNRLVDLNGGSASAAFNFNRYLSLVADFGGYDDTQLRLAGPGANPPSVVASSASAFTYLFGPRLSFRNHSRLTPFAQVLFGVAHAGEVTLSNCTASCTPLLAQTAFALTAGGGFDIRLARHISLRAIQAEYLLTRFPDPATGAGSTQNDIRLSTGFLFRLGGDPLVAPPADRSFTVVCSADTHLVYAGSPEAVIVRAHSSPSATASLTYTWTANGGSIEGTGPEARWSASAVPGAYTIRSHVDDGRGGTGDCSSDIQVAQQTSSPPIMAPAETHNPAAVEAQPAPSPLELRLSLHSIYFPTAQPTTADPLEGLLPSQKQTLISLAGDFNEYLQSHSGAQLILEGHADPRGSVQYNQALSQRRVESTRRFLSEHGISSASIQIRAIGVQENLTDAQVREAVEQSPELTSEQKQKMLGNMTIIILASNRRVDITLTTTGQHSVRQYPFNAVDSLALLNPEESRQAQKSTTKSRVTSAPE